MAKKATTKKSEVNEYSGFSRVDYTKPTEVKDGNELIGIATYEMQSKTETHVFGFKNDEKVETLIYKY